MPGAAAMDEHGAVVRVRPGGAHLPQPEWFGDYSVERRAQRARLDAALLHRRARRAAPRLQGAEELTWRSAPADVVAFERPAAGSPVTNFSERPVPMPEGRLVIASRALDGLELPAETTVWLSGADA